jgi:outer membrane protein assembly factor BamB
MRRHLFLLGGLAAALAACRPLPTPATPAPTVEPAPVPAPVSPPAPAPPPPPAAVDTRADTGIDWPRLLGPRADGKSPETGILTRWPAGGPPVLWSARVGRGYSMPSVAQGRLFVFDRQGAKERLRCLRGDTGEELWSTEYVTDYKGYLEENGGPVASPLIDGDRVYTFGIEGRLRCLRVADGELLWEVDTAARFGVVQNLYGAAATPWIEDDLLIAVIGGSPAGSPDIHSGEVRGDGSGIVAFDKRTGEVRYRITDELASYSSPVVVPLGGRRQGLAVGRGGLVGFEPRAGKVDFFFPWRDRTGRGVNASMPVVVDDTVFVTEAYGPGGALIRVKPEGGYEVVWQDPPRGAKSMACHFNTPIHHQGYLYGTSGRTSADAELRCVEHATGKVMWSQPGLNLTNLLYADGHLIALTERGRLLLIDATPERFRIVSEVDLGGPKPGAAPAAATDAPAAQPLLRYPAWNAPVLSHGLLYVRGWDRVVCFDLRR